MPAPSLAARCRSAASQFFSVRVLGYRRKVGLPDVRYVPASVADHIRRAPAHPARGHRLEPVRELHLRRHPPVNVRRDVPGDRDSAMFRAA